MRLSRNSTVVVILGGGRGSRLYPLTRNRAKPAVSFGGKYRLVDIPIANCLRSDLDRIFVLTQFNSFSLNRHVWQAYTRELGRNGFVDVIAAEQTPTSPDWFQGTADAVRRSLPYILYHDPARVLILSGDQVYSMDYGNLIQWHEAHEAKITVMAHWKERERLSEFGVVRIDEDYRVLDFREKPGPAEALAGYAVRSRESPVGRPYLASMGIYLFDTDALVAALEGGESDFGKTVIPAAARKTAMCAYPFDGYWEDVGTIRAFYDANMLWRRGGGIATLFEDGATMVTHSRQLPPSRLRDSFVDDSIVADGCDIRSARIHRSIVGVRARIDEGSVVEDALVMGNDRMPPGSPPEIGKRCRIRNAILDKNVRLGDACILANEAGIQDADHDLYVIRSGIIVVPANTALPAGLVV